MVRNAARLAVYNDMMMIVKIHQTPSTTRPGIEFGPFSSPKNSRLFVFCFSCFLLYINMMVEIFFGESLCINLHETHDPNCIDRALK